MLEQLIKELEELKEIKKKYECAIKDKQTMSEKLYEYMLKEYESTTKEERILHYKENTCKYCKYKNECNFWLPDDIGEPIPSENAWFPATRGCGEFDWA